MKVLAMETSTLLGSVALVIDGKLVAEEISFRQKSHTEIINVFVDNCLQKAGLTLSDIDVFAIGQGPGSFTGIRVAANAGKTYAYSFEKPLVAVDTLTLLATPALKLGKPVLAIINAYKNMVYSALFDESGKMVKGPEAVPVRHLSAFVDRDVVVVGDGWEAFHEYFPAELSAKMTRNSSLEDSPHASTLAMLAYERAKQGQTLDWKSFVPLYIRASEAEETKKGILITPLK
ncbi:tRNA (adenosine(37)-N6)-threonylcarbamoyltransferase complex dimerization subunit type 1 TsaB [Bdellovibrio sp. HCB2-146]|uniref:tRNA (adenosine(37)-N6)-threonylcarbamoyltransferase complex dimerization subunit type 1 TsaB n=1 Tax=Bdellovibrio sp. HCB2-146 TaxID=3394362 RepID=UPI0039BD24B7